MVWKKEGNAAILLMMAFAYSSNCYFFLCPHLPPIVFARKISLSFLSSGFQLKGFHLKKLLIIPLYEFHYKSVKAFFVDPHRFCSAKSLTYTHICRVARFFSIIFLLFSIKIIQRKSLSFLEKECKKSREILIVAECESRSTEALCIVTVKVDRGEEGFWFR